MPEESPEAKAARERLTGVLLLAALVIGVACGVATGDGGLGFGAFIAACLVGGMVLQRRHPPANPEPPPRWGIVASFIAGPMLIAIGVFNIVDGSTVVVGDDIPLIQGDELAGAIRIVCGVISIWFAFDQRALRRRRAEAIKAVVRAGLRDATLHVGGGWVRPPAGPSGLAEATRERRPAALAPRDVVPLDLGSPAPAGARRPGGPDDLDGGHWEGGVFLWAPHEADDEVGDGAAPEPDRAVDTAAADGLAAAAAPEPHPGVDPPSEGPIPDEPWSDGGLVHGPVPSSLPAPGARPEPAPSTSEPAVPDWFAAMWDGPAQGEGEGEGDSDEAEVDADGAPQGASATTDGDHQGSEVVEVEDLPPLPRRVRGASLFRPSRLPGSLEDSLDAEMSAPPPEVVEPPEAAPVDEAVAPPTSPPERVEAPAATEVGPDPAALDAGQGDEPTDEADEAPVVDLAAIERASRPPAEPEPAGSADLDPGEATDPEAPETSDGRPPLPRGIRILRKREPRPEFDSDELV